MPLLARDDVERGTEVAALAAAAREGDREAFRRLFEAHQRGVYTLLAYLVGSPDDAADLAQTTFVKAWRALPGLREPATFTAWLYRIARNAVRDHQRKTARRVPVVALPAAAEEATAGAEADLLAEERREAVRRAVTSLPAKHREVVAMHHLNGLDVRTIGEVLGVPTNTVISRLSRARQTLRRALTSVVEEG